MEIQRQQGGPPSETIWLCVILATFLTVNLLTASLSPTVWLDEVMLADPAVNLRLTGHFTSSAWNTQSDQAFWSGYPPLYSFLLSGWLWLAPISPTGVRSFNFMLMALSCVVLWSALRHTEIVRSPGARLLFVVLVLCGASTTFGYRSGRPDTLGVFLLSLLALLVARRPSSLRSWLIFAVSCLLPWAGLQLVIYAAILAAIAVVVTRTIPRTSLLLAAGVAAGGLAFILFYAAAGTLSAFITSASSHTALRSDSDHDLGSLLTLGREILFTDHSIGLLLPVIAIAAVMAYRKALENRQIVWFFVLAIVVVPPVLQLLGKFPFYYFWMVYIPLGLLSAIVIDRPAPRKSYVAIATFLLACGAILVGLPARMAIAVLEADGRDYSKVSAYVTAALKPDDKAFIHFPAYYPARLRAKAVYLPGYLRVISDSERRDVNVAVLSGDAKDAEAELSKAFGGQWEKAGPDYAPDVNRGLFGFLRLATPYRFVVLRRKPAEK